MRRKILAFGLAAALAIGSLSACGNTGGGGTGGGGTGGTGGDAGGGGQPGGGQTTATSAAH